MKKTCFFIFFILFSFRTIAQNIDLSLHLRIGNTYYTNNTISSSIEQNQHGKEVNFDAHIVVKTAYKVVKIIDTIYSVEVRYKKLSLKIYTVKGQASYSSVNAAKNDETSQLLAALIDRPFLIRLSNTGKVLSVENIDGIANNLLAKISGSDQEQKELLKTQVMKYFGEQSFRERLQETLAVYPAAKISKNESWMIDSRILSLGELHVNTTYKLASMTNSYYVIHGYSNISTDKNTLIQVHGVPVSYEMCGTIYSDTKVNNKTGWIIEAKLQQDASGSYRIQDNPKFPGGMTVPIKLNTIVTTTN